jgi:hypothetical protein
MIFDNFIILLLGIFIASILLACLDNGLRSNWKRRVILRKYAHTEKILFALSPEETIVGVSEEHNTLCFHTAKHRKDEKEYE